MMTSKNAMGHCIGPVCFIGVGQVTTVKLWQARHTWVQQPVHEFLQLSIAMHRLAFLINCSAHTCAHVTVRRLPLSNLSVLALLK